MSITCGRNACAVRTTYDPAGYDLPAAVKLASAPATSPCSRTRPSTFAPDPMTLRGRRAGGTVRTPDASR